MIQHLATEVPVEQIQILNVHPGEVYTEGLQRLCEKDSWPSWDEGEFSLTPDDDITYWLINCC